jgi:hypothetical protein
MKHDTKITLSVALEPELPPELAAHDDNSTELPPEVASNVHATSPDSDLEVGTISQVVQSLVPSASPTREQLVTSLFLVSSFTALFGLTAVFHLPAAGPVFGRYKDSYYIILVMVLAAAAVELATAYWLAFSNGQCCCQDYTLSLSLSELEEHKWFFCAACRMQLFCFSFTLLSRSP